MEPGTSPPTRFVKMHGAGNDFMIIDAREQVIRLTPQRVRRLADRRRGVGFDQLILLEPSEQADVRLRFFNPDGGESGACGNGTRCAAALLGGSPLIETAGGFIRVSAGSRGVTADMGVPRFGWAEVPLAHAMDTSALPVAWEGLEAPVAVSMGNPHVVFFVPDVEAIELDRLGPLIETDPLFPERVNVNVATVPDRDRIRLRVWERGAGLTLACGTGACAAFAAARRRGLVGPSAVVELPGGDLAVEEGAEGRLRLTGPAETSFIGETRL